jgi:hypothetical protein
MLHEISDRNGKLDGSASSFFCMDAAFRATDPRTAYCASLELTCIVDGDNCRLRVDMV